MAHSAVGNEDFAVIAVNQSGLEVRICLALTNGKVGCLHKLVRYLYTVFAGFKANQEGEVGVGGDVVFKEFNALIDKIFLKNDVTHRHCKCSVGTGLSGKPLIGKLGVISVVR